MDNAKVFNPIATARKIERSYKEYIATTIHFADSDLQTQLEGILDRPGYLAKGPFLESTPPYRKDKSVSELIDEGVFCSSMLELGQGSPEGLDPDRPLYSHQVKAIRKASSGRNFAVVTGTGSGKTECFLLPILNDILSEFEREGASAGVRAMILYPMNALANDQLKRLRGLLRGSGITFGRYIGDTEEEEKRAIQKWKEENPGEEKLPNEIISREEIRKNPPNILLTNYSMLEYLLLRPEDAPLFGKVFGSKWRHIAIDEAHIYSGALGTEISYLLRRLKARIRVSTGKPIDLRCYATSATIGSEADMPKVAKFAQDLFGEPFACDGDDFDVITADRESSQDFLDEESWGRLSLGSWEELRDALGDSRESLPSIRDILFRGGAPQDILRRMDGKPLLVGLGHVLLGEDSAMNVVKRCADLFDLTDLSCMATIGIEGLEGDESGISALVSMVEVLSVAQRSEGVPVLSSRYHSFLRAPEGVYLNLHTRRLTPHKTISQSYDGVHETPVYEVSVCRHCGQAYILGVEEPAGELLFSWLNPRHDGTDADDEFLPRTFYRVLANPADKDADEMIQWLCPICGSLHGEDRGGSHCFVHEDAFRVPVALDQLEKNRSDEEVARCRHCGYSSRIAIQPMRVSPEAAGSVVCYDLVRDIPPFEDETNAACEEDDWFADVNDERRAGSVICFSDRRQDAAFFCPFYGAYVRKHYAEAAYLRGCQDEMR